jgi:hypothetical protein
MKRTLLGMLAAAGIITVGISVLTNNATEPINKTDTKSMMLVCKDTGGIKVKWNIDTKAVVPDNCKIVSSKITKEDRKSSNTKTALETELETVCYPCKISPGQWGQCPGCLLLEGGCAKACPVPVKLP